MLGLSLKKYNLDFVKFQFCTHNQYLYFIVRINIHYSRVLNKRPWTLMISKEISCKNLCSEMFTVWFKYKKDSILLEKSSIIFQDIRKWIVTFHDNGPILQNLHFHFFAKKCIKIVFWTAQKYNLAVKMISKSKLQKYGTFVQKSNFVLRILKHSANWKKFEFTFVQF